MDKKVFVEMEKLRSNNKSCKKEKKERKKERKKESSFEEKNEMCVAYK